MFRKFLAAAALLASTAASAATWQATSKHFVVHKEGTEQEARALAIKLEKFHAIMRVLTGVKEEKPALKLRLFMLKNSDEVNALLPGGGGNALGFYSSDIRGPYAVMNSMNDGIDSQTVLFHELSHHFMYQYRPATYPVWYTEGFADYHGTIKIGEGDQVTVGDIVPDRYRTLGYGGWVPIKKVLAAHSYADLEEVTHIYAEGWLLTHFLSTDVRRKGQLAAYLKAINAGQSYLDAAKVFGDLDKLNSELTAYATKSALKTSTYKFKPIDPGTITARQLRADESALLASEAQLSVGVLKRDVGGFADRVVKLAGRYPNSPHALRVQTDALLMAERNEAARDTAARFMAAAPQDPLAATMKATADLRLLAAAKSTDAAAWTAAREPLRQAMLAAPRDPWVLKAFYDSYDLQGKLPPPVAWRALNDAYALLPRNSELGYAVARDYERRGMIDDAIAEISVFAYQSKDEESAKERAKRAKQREKYRMAGDDSTESARDMLARLLKLKGGKPGEASAPKTVATS